MIITFNKRRMTVRADGDHVQFDEYAGVTDAFNDANDEEGLLGEIDDVLEEDVEKLGGGGAAAAKGRPSSSSSSPKHANSGTSSSSSPNTKLVVGDGNIGINGAASKVSSAASGKLQL
jgi:hypothetical protein